MSQQEDQTQSQQMEGSQVEGSQMQDSAIDEYGEAESALQDDIFRNNHDLIGVEGILKAQKNEIEKKKLELRMKNERYLREHPEINYIVELFVSKILDDRPENILEYGGTFFDSAGLREQVEKYTKQEMANSQKQKHLNDLIKGKCLI